MTGALFLAGFDALEAGDELRITGDEARHATVKRITVGERVLVSNGQGLGGEGTVSSVGRDEVVVTIDRVLHHQPRREVIVVQALAKGDRALLAVQMLTEVGVSRIIAWQSERSIVRWSGERGDKSLEKWRATARESAKQARRLTIPDVEFATTKTLPDALGDVGTLLVLHEDATQHLRDVTPAEGPVALVVGPEGGITPAELDALTAAGGLPVRISDHVLRTSTAGAVAVGQLEML